MVFRQPGVISGWIVTYLIETPKWSPVDELIKYAFNTLFMI